MGHLKNIIIRCHDQCHPLNSSPLYLSHSHWCIPPLSTRVTVIGAPLPPLAVSQSLVHRSPLPGLQSLVHPSPLYLSHSHWCTPPLSTRVTVIGAPLPSLPESQSLVHLSPLPGSVIGAPLPSLLGSQSLVHPSPLYQSHSH